MPRKNKHIGSKKLESIVDHDYLSKGYSKAKSKYIAGAVAGKVYREQKSNRKKGK